MKVTDEYQELQIILVLMVKLSDACNDNIKGIYVGGSFTSSQRAYSIYMSIIYKFGISQTIKFSINIPVILPMGTLEKDYRCTAFTLTHLQVNRG